MGQFSILLYIHIQMNADGISWSMSSFEGIEVKAVSLEKLHEHYIHSPKVPFGEKKKWLCLWWLTDTSHNEGLLKNDFSFTHTLLEHLEVRISEVKTSLIFIVTF